MNSTNFMIGLHTEFFKTQYWFVATDQHVQKTPKYYINMQNAEQMEKYIILNNFIKK